MENSGNRQRKAVVSSHEEESYSSQSDQDIADFVKQSREIEKQFNNQSKAKPEGVLQANQDVRQHYNLQDKAFNYGGKSIESLPKWMQGLEGFTDAIKQNSSLILSSLTAADKERLFALLPAKVKNKDRLLSQIMKGEKVGNLGQSPLDQFGLKLQSQAFTKAHLQYKGYCEELQLLRRREQLDQHLKYIQSLLNQERRFKEDQIEGLLSQLIQPVGERQYLASGEELSVDSQDGLLGDSDSEEHMNEEEKQAYHDIHAEFDELTSGYTTISSNKGEYQQIRKPVNSLIQQQTGNSFLTRLAMLQNAQNNQIGQAAANQEPKQQQQNNESSFSGMKQEQQKQIGQGQKKPNQMSLLGSKVGGGESGSKRSKYAQQQSMDPIEEVDVQRILDKALASDRFRNLKKSKNYITIPKTSPGWIETYRNQEEERYKNPTRPWVFFNEDGSTSIVGPVIKKKQQPLNQKPRDHPMLYSNRPAIVTLLCLARDAASRLPDGVGTRADILELIKQSQWLKVEGTTPENLNNIVSGALDRLHYEEDACVKYEADKKLWVYKHNQRPVDFPPWSSGIFGESPNTIENNSLNPFIGTEKELCWLESAHKEKRYVPPSRLYNDEFNPNVGVGFDQPDDQDPQKTNKFIVKIRFEKEAEPSQKPPKSLGKRQKQQAQQHKILNFNEYGGNGIEHPHPPKAKRPKH